MKENFTGKLLVASSLASDPMYSGGVCLIVHHDENNVIGVMVNRPIQPSPGALLEMLGAAASEQSSAPTEPASVNRIEAQLSPPSPPPAAGGSATHGILHFGGPRSGPVVAIHQTSQYAEAETGEGIYVAATREHLQQLVRQQPAPYRLIVGHLSWEADELQQELEAGLWHVVPATAESVFSNASEMWPRLIRRATSSSVARWIGTADLPQAGEVN